MFVDGSCGNSLCNVVGTTNAFRIQVQSIPCQGLRIRRPKYSDPSLYKDKDIQIDAVTNYDPSKRYC